MVQEIVRGFYLLVIVFLVLTLLTNINPRIPRFPWDIFIDKFGFGVYLPITSSLVLTILLSVILKIDLS